MYHFYTSIVMIMHISGVLLHSVNSINSIVFNNRELTGGWRKPSKEQKHKGKCVTDLFYFVVSLITFLTCDVTEIGIRGLRKGKRKK